MTVGSDVVVLDSATVSQASALNAADAITTTFPRLYPDADIAIMAETVLAVFLPTADAVQR